MGSGEGLKTLEIARLANGEHDPVMLGERNGLYQRKVKKLAGIVVKAGERHTHPRRCAVRLIFGHDRIPLFVVAAKIAILANMGRTHAQPQRADNSIKRHCPDGQRRSAQGQFA